MKVKLFLMSILWMAVSSVAHAVPIAFEVNYTNHAWGYQNNGCFVDEARFIYTYDISGDSPIKNVGRVSEEAFSEAQGLLNKAREGAFELKHVMADAGTELYVGYLWGEKIKLEQRGDLQGRNSAPEAAELVTLISEWCKGS